MDLALLEAIAAKKAAVAVARKSKVSASKPRWSKTKATKKAPSHQNLSAADKDEAASLGAAASVGAAAESEDAVDQLADGSCGLTTQPALSPTRLVENLEIPFDPHTTSFWI